MKVNADVSSHLRQNVIADMLRYHERMPLGLCIYPTSRKSFDLVRSWSRELETVTHDGPAGVCAHRIAVDDGGLFEVDEHPEDDSRLIKVRVLRCHISTPFQRPDGRWSTRNTYTITCPHGDIEYVRTWEPDGIRHLPDTNPNKRSPQDPIGWRLRPLSRADDTAAWYNVEDNAGGWVDHADSPRPFSDVYSRRNDAESYNEWYQQSLPHHGRATSLHPSAQELDFLLGAVLNNCITWSNRR